MFDIFITLILPPKYTYQVISTGIFNCVDNVGYTMCLERVELISHVIPMLLHAAHLQIVAQVAHATILTLVNIGHHLTSRSSRRDHLLD